MYKLIDSKKFHSMNATVETVRFDDGMTFERLVSYDSVVCDVCLDTGAIYIYPRFQYSPTTVRQLTRFLNEYMPLVYGRWSIDLIRYLQDKTASDRCMTLCKYGLFYFGNVLGTSRSW